MLIGVCGYGYTGSGAVLDFLKEFEENVVIDNMEFTLSYYPDGLEDLEYHLIKNVSRYFSSDAAIKRFNNYIKSLNTLRSPYKKLTNGKFYEISNRYIESLIQVKWKGYWAFDFINGCLWRKNFEFRFMLRILNILDKILRRNTNLPPNHEMYLSVNPDDFYSLSKNYIKELLCSICDTNKNIVLDQPFSADNPEKSFAFFDKPIAITVDKDPRDLFLLAKKVVLSKGRFMPSDNVTDFIKYYKTIRTNEQKSQDSSKVLRINFEDMIYEYEFTSKRIIEFLGLKSHDYPKKYFKPEVSINNTQIFNKYMNYKEEIEYIEHELKEWLYPFNKYGEIKSIGRSF